MAALAPVPINRINSINSGAYAQDDTGGLDSCRATIDTIDTIDKRDTFDAIGRCATIDTIDTIDKRDTFDAIGKCAAIDTIDTIDKRDAIGKRAAISASAPSFCKNAIKAFL